MSDYTPDEMELLAKFDEDEKAIQKEFDRLRELFNRARHGKLEKKEKVELGKLLNKYGSDV